MRTLPTLGVCGWLVVAVTLPALSALKWIAVGVAQAQQLSPPDWDKPNLLQKEPLDLFQKEPLFRINENFFSGLQRYTPLVGGPLTGDWLNSLWVSSVTDSLNDYRAEQARKQARDREFWRSLFSVGNIRGSSPLKGDFWSPGEFNNLMGR